MYQGLGQTEVVTSGDPVAILDSPGDTTTTTLHVGGGYAGQPVISPSLSAGYEGVSTVNSPDASFPAQAGQWIKNNLLLVGIGLYGLVLFGGGRRR